MTQVVFVTGGSGFVGRNLIRALVARGDRVRALARSDASVAAVARLGAEPVAGDLDDVEAMTQGMRGCDWAAHAAAYVQEWGPRDLYERVNVAGTRNAIAAARVAKVKRFVHVGTEAAFATGRPLVRLDEAAPFPARVLPRYPATKQAAEKLVRAANGGELQTVVVRPRLIWGKDDTSILPQLVQAVRDGRYMTVSGGRALTSTCHVDNVVEGVLLAAEKGKPGEAYFLTDGAPVPIGVFLRDLLATQGVQAPDKSVPLWLAWSFATLIEKTWDALKLRSHPPVTRIAVALGGVEVTVDDAKARRELGYAGRVTREAGLAAMRAAAKKA